MKYHFVNESILDNIIHADNSGKIKFLHFNTILTFFITHWDIYIRLVGYFHDLC